MFTSLGEGLIPEIADKLEIVISDEPNVSDLQALMNQVGPDKRLRNNPDLNLDRDVMVDIVDRSGLQKALNRSLWTPEQVADYNSVDAWTIQGAVANWQDRTARLIKNNFRCPVYSVAGDRPMTLDTEKTNHNVDAIFKTFGRYPTESEYAASIIVAKLAGAGVNVLPSSYDTRDGDELARKLFAANPNLINSRLAVARVANAGIIMALQIRHAARSLNPEFDADKQSPQIFVVTDSFPLATTDKQEKDPQNFQKVDSALRQTVLTAKKLHEAAER